MCEYYFEVAVFERLRLAVLDNVFLGQGHVS